MVLSELSALSTGSLALLEKPRAAPQIFANKDESFIMADIWRGDFNDDWVCGQLHGSHPVYSPEGRDGTIPGPRNPEIFLNVSIFFVCVRRFSLDKNPTIREISASTYENHVSKFYNSSGTRSYSVRKMMVFHEIQ